jgi:hypothetical protein
MRSKSPPTGRLRAWLVSVVAGLVIGIPAAALGVLGLGLGFALGVGAAVTRPRIASFAGVLLGLGVSWVLLLARAAIACSDESCVGPDLAPWLVGAGAVAGSGLVLSVVELARWRMAP